MSRNFELLMQFESEVGAKGHRLASDYAVPIRTAIHRDDESCGEEMSDMVQSLFLSPDGNPPHQIVFCGVDGDSGSSSVCASVGRALISKSSKSVCLVDANVHSPRLSAIFGLDRQNRFSGNASSVREQCVSIGNNLWLGGAELLTGDFGALHSVDELKRLLIQLRAIFDYVLIDAPGLNVCGDATIFGQAADATVLVIEANRTRRLNARKAKETLDAAGVRLIGTVLRNRSFPIPERLYKLL